MNLSGHEWKSLQEVPYDSFQATSGSGINHTAKICTAWPYHIVGHFSSTLDLNILSNFFHHGYGASLKRYDGARQGGPDRCEGRLSLALPLHVLCASGD